MFGEEPGNVIAGGRGQSPFRDIELVITVVFDVEELFTRLRILVQFLNVHWYSYAVSEYSKV